MSDVYLAIIGLLCVEDMQQAMNDRGEKYGSDALESQTTVLSIKRGEEFGPIGRHRHRRPTVGEYHKRHIKAVDPQQVTKPL